MTMLTEDLKSIGFGKNEADVFVSLQELGKSGAGNIIEKTGLHRNLRLPGWKLHKFRGPSRIRKDMV